MGSMLTLQTAGADVTMSSREIADLVEKRHDNVFRTIESLLARGTIALPQLEEVLNDGPGPRMVSQYRVGKRDSYVIVAQLSPEFTARLVDRWQELEAAVPAPAELSRLQILEIAMASERERVALAAQVAAAAPAVEFVGRFVESTGLMTFRQVAKLLKVKEPDFRHFLREAKIMYVLNGEWTAHAQHIEAGRFEVRAGTAPNSHAYNTSKFTAKGVEWVAGELAKWQLKQRQEEVAHA